MQRKHPAPAAVVKILESFIDHSPANRMGLKSREKCWDRVLVGFAGGGDPVFRKFKRDIGRFYLTPLEIFSRTFPEIGSVRPEALTVIAWILPQTMATKRDHRRAMTVPSERWVRARNFGERFNRRLRGHLSATLSAMGFPAVAPLLTPLSARKTSRRFGHASTWSERHAAYAAGLGTFGLCDGLITPAGKAVRCGSVVARISLPPTGRPYRDHREYCLHFNGGTCTRCMERCPAGAVTAAGHNKKKCRDYTHKRILRHSLGRFGLKSFGCGMCQTGVPCESRIPFRKKTGK
jgi:epoxyqueuosine reductase QueG